MHCKYLRPIGLTAIAWLSTALGPVFAQGILPPGDLAFLEDLTRDVVEASRVRPGEKIGAIGPNVTGGTVIRPGGRDCYPAFWIRDYAMSLESDMVTPEEQRHMLLLTASHQQDDEWPLPSGSVVTPGSIPDHISFGNKPIFYPGTLEDYEGQGGPRWGKLPCLDDAFFFVHMATQYVESTGNVEILSELVREKTLLTRLQEAYAMPPSRADTGLVYADEESRGVTFGFVDTIIHTGDLLFCSLLKLRAAEELARLAEFENEPELVKRYTGESMRLRTAIEETFALDDGLYRASTGKSAQPDVWGTAFGVYIGAFSAERTRAACERLAGAYRDGTLAWRGNVRHVLTTDDFSATTAWESTDVPVNRYQNGAYWGTPVGWVCDAIAQVDAEAAAQLAAEYVAELREGDFRKGPEFGSPWECMHPDDNHRQNPVYMTSVTCPLAAFRRILSEQSTH
ncbi:MAG: hypothetical protein KJ060_14855 [Candidatus Hydrogenedentes bacterium]|nr:hypothetical protein [Candidatus Hydrogenedentota bacterium]